MPISRKKLNKILKRYGVWQDPSKGKGSHTTYLRSTPEGVFSYPIPTHGNEVLDGYVSGLRKRLRLTSDDGVDDKEFFGK